MKRTLFLLILLLLVFPTSSYARTWLVRQDGSGDCLTIQACVNAAAAGDSVLVYPGIYQEHVVVACPVSLIGLSGSGSTIIDGAQTGRCVLFDRIPFPGVVLKGFTVRNGEMQTPPTSFFNTVGGGIFSRGSVGLVSDCVLELNRGGGIACDDSSNVVIERNLIQKSISTYEGQYPGYGVGVITRSSDTVIRENTFLDNQDHDVTIQASSPQVIGNKMLGSSTCGGIIGAGSAHIAENLIVNCQQSVRLYGSPHFTKNTLVNNATTGVGLGPGASPVVSNNIIVGHPVGIDCDDGAPTLLCNDVWNNGVNYYCVQEPATDFHLDPEFCDQGQGDYSLNCTSPCVNYAGCGQVGAFGAGCGPTTVTETTWGNIKALFR